MTNSMQSEWIKEAYNGGGWENSIKISSFDEFRNALLDLGASISFNEEFQGLTHAVAHVDGRLYFSETDIDSYRSYLTTEKSESYQYWANGHFSEYHETYNGSPVTFSIQNPDSHFINHIFSYNTENQYSYLALNTNSTGIGLENGYNIAPTPLTNNNPASPNPHIATTREVNPEIVLELDSDFWEDIKELRDDINQQRTIGDNIQFEVNGFNDTVELSSLRFSNNNTERNEIIDQFNFTLVTNERWDLPLYGGSNATVHVKAYGGDPNTFTNYNFHLKDHDSIGYEPPAVMQGLTGAVELTEDGSSTVFEFGLDQGHIQNLIQDAQKNWNENGSNTTFEIENIMLDFQLPDGSYYHVNKPVYSGNQVIKVNPVTTQVSDFSEFGDIGIQITGDFDSVIDIWNSDENAPNIQLTSDGGLTRYQHANLHFNYEGIDSSGGIASNQTLHINSNLGLHGSNNTFLNFAGNNYSSDVTEFRLRDISYNSNRWAIPGAPSQPPTAVEPSTNWRYDHNSPGTALFADAAGNTVYIEDIIPNINELAELSFANLNTLEAADKLDASVELTLENSRLPWNVNYTEPEPSDTLETYYSLQELDQLAVLGDSVDEYNKYDLTITAKMLGDLRLEGAGLTIGYDNTLFTNLTESDIYLGSSFMPSYTNKPSEEDGSQFGGQPIYVDHANGEIHISAFSAEDLGQGKAISEESIFATISLDFNEHALRQLEKNSDGSLKINPLSFTIKADQDETIFTKDFDDGTDYGNREIQSLRDLNKEIVVEGREVTLYDAAINLEQLGDGLVLGTQRVIGANQGFTNLIRSGDTITSTVDWRNVGNITAKNLQVYGEYNDYAHLVNYSLSQNSLNSGSFQGGQFFEEGREDVTITAAIEVTGSAGDVLDISNGIFSIEADGSSVAFENRGKGSANLITYAGDLNYDGRVSMKDLAYLNAGAARQIEQSDGSVVEESVAKDVDANFDGRIDMGDLTVLDQDWGRTLHTGDETFTGSNATLNWDSLDAQASSTWDNTAFKEQNQVEADIAYVETLGTAGDLSGAYDTSTPNTGDGGDTGTETSTI